MIRGRPSVSVPVLSISTTSAKILALAALYMERHAEPRKRSVRNDRAMLRGVLSECEGPIPAAWKHRRLTDLTRDDVAQLHARLGRDRGHYTANRTLALVRTMSNLARAWGLLAGENVSAGVKLFRETKRERFLSPDELRRVLAEVEAEPDERWRAYFKLALLLGPRKSELLCAPVGARRPRGADVEPPPDEGRADRTCSRSRRPRWRSWRRWRAASRADGCSRARRRRAATWRRSRVPGGGSGRGPGCLTCAFTISGGRLGSWLASSGCGLPIIGKALNHSQPSTTAVYARLSLEPVREALEKNARLMLGDGPAS